MAGAPGPTPRPPAVPRSPPRPSKAPGQAWGHPRAPLLWTRGGVFSKSRNICYPQYLLLAKLAPSHPGSSSSSCSSFSPYSSWFMLLLLLLPPGAPRVGGSRRTRGGRSSSMCTTLRRITAGRWAPPHSSPPSPPHRSPLQVSITPNVTWGGEGSLGCGIGYCYLHSLLHRCGLVWRGVACCGVVWRGVAWCGVVWRGVA